MALGSLLLVVLLIGAAAVVLLSAHASLSSDGEALAQVGLPLGGGTIEQAAATTGPHSRQVPVSVRGRQIWPRQLIPAHQLVTVDVVVKRPGWVSWLSGDTERLHLTLMTPSVSLRQHYLTLAPGQPLVLHFRSPVRVIASGAIGALRRRVLGRATTVVRLQRPAEAGTLSVAAAPRIWETSSPTLISYFPAGSAASVVASPAPGSQISAHTPITLTFSRTIRQALGNSRPPVSPASPGSWHVVNSHTITFDPNADDYGYGLGATVTIPLPAGVRLVGAQRSGNASSGVWKVAGGATLRLQQLLAELGYLPLRFHAARRVPASPAAQEDAAVHPPAGHFAWRYPNVPAALRAEWAPGASGVMTQGALMRFQDEHGLTSDGVAGAKVWKSLINAAVAGRRYTGGYTFVSVDKESSPESLSLWHSGKVVFNTEVNTGISSAPTASGTYPVFEHVPVTTMSGTNPDGSSYSDPGIQYVSYFNGGDALHAFTRAQYGSPQSLGCVEMDLSSAAKVYPYTPIGTLVHVG